MTHNCRDHLQPCAGYDTQPHGETHWNEGWRCSICGEVYDDRDADELPDDEEDEEARVAA